MSPSVWEEYPQDYRADEVSAILAALRAGECVSLVGLSGAGKSNLVGFLANRCAGQDLPELLLADCNRLEGSTAEQVFCLLGETLGSGDATKNLRGLEKLVDGRLAAHTGGVSLLLDRFDSLNDLASGVQASSLRALRDHFKYRLTYLIATRRPLDPRSELAELFYANTLWLGPLSASDATWSAGQYARRRGMTWEEGALRRLVELSWGYPSLLRAACEAYASGCALETQALRQAPAVRRRVHEFWADSPSPGELRLSGLEGHPLLAVSGEARAVDPAELTAGEQRLLDYMRGREGEICLKDELIRAVWPDEAIAGGLRDDSLAQLVHRLREKIGARAVQTVAGRGYRYNSSR